MRFRVADISVYIGYEAVAAMTAVLLLDRENRFICCFFAAIIHELGHLLMMKLAGVKVTGLRLRLFDVLIEADEPPSFSADVWITLGGVAANLLFFILLFPFGKKLSLPHLALCLFNILPVMSLDGGRLLYLCLSRRYSPRICDTALRISTFVLMLPLMTVGIMLLLDNSYNYTLLAVSLYLLTILFIKH